MTRIYTSVSTTRWFIWSLAWLFSSVAAVFCFDSEESAFASWRFLSTPPAFRESVRGVKPPTVSLRIRLLCCLLMIVLQLCQLKRKLWRMQKVRWSWWCRSGKVRGWHFNCAYVIYGACRASIVKQFETEKQFIALEQPSDLERNAGLRSSLDDSNHFLW